MRFPFLTTLLSLSLVLFLFPTGEVFGQTPEAEVEAEPDVAESEDDEEDPSVVRREQLADEAAMSLFNAGSVLFEAGRFLEAAEQFQAAYELSPRPVLLFNTYLAYRDAGQNDQAVTALAAYLEAAPDADDAERLTNRLSAMRASAEADAEAEAAAAAERERLAAEGEAARRQAAAERARADEERARAEEAQGRRHPLGIIVAAVGGALVVAGGVTAIVANKRFTTLEEQCPSQFCSIAADLEGNRSGIQRLQRTTDALLFGGAAVLITGLVLTFTLDPGPPPPAEPTAFCTNESCELGVRGSF